VTLVDTGVQTRTAGRLKRARPHIGSEEFCSLTETAWRTSTSSIDRLSSQPRQNRHRHRRSAGRKIRPFGPRRRRARLQLQEKTLGDGGWINGGFFVLKPEVFDYLPETQTS
jgi:glucose-1-phosphate cytidylyltransferase